MATNIQRATSVIDALVNGTATATQKQRVLDAYALLAPAGSTSEQIAGVFLAQHRDNILTQVKFAERASALAATNAQVEADFTPAP